ncbi:hypothetical protein [Luteolibacter luteus]|uniref:Uncharacterized protein n=1 Tax=Luteolibacter luteus TaxID=2728835 RepID=A0A858RHV4_9BACT|nr:hypothetical protein [Luteolibacter luteus]QJE96766.1 hypothetical protein HHL09_13560 [Luteolibacter luteus]
MKSHRYLWLGTAVLGTATGLLVPKGQKPAASAAAFASETPGKGTTHQEAAKDAAATKTAANLGPLPVSKDSIEGLLAVEPAELYSRVGLWLLDASAEDTAAFWKAYQGKGDVDMWIKDLIFTQWAKKDLDGLMEAAKRDGEEGPAWWAWTMSDPDAALAAMEGQSDSIRSFVLRGVANFHVERGMKMLEKDPSMARFLDLSNLSEEIGRKDPEAALEFLTRYNSHDLSTAVRNWAKDDPRRTLEWLAERSPDQSLIKQFAETVAEEDPKALAELAEGLPSGSLKRELETQVIRKLAETDPDKAIEAARKIESPSLAAQRLAEVGKIMVAENPEKALETLAMIFEACPDVTYRGRMIRYPSGGSGSYGTVAGLPEFITELASWNPAHVMDSVTEIEANAANAKPGANPPQSNSATAMVASVWLGKDPEGFAEWCGRQEGATFDAGASAAANFLTNRDDFAEALAWSQQIKDHSLQLSSIMSGFSRWASSDREAAIRWYEQAALPDDIGRHLKPYLPKNDP